MYQIFVILFTFLISQISIANSIIGKGLFCSKISNTDRYEKYIAIHIHDKKRINVWTYPENSLKEEMHNYEIDGLTIHFIPNFVERTKFSGKLNRKDLTARIMNIDYQCKAKDMDGIDFTSLKLKEYIENIIKKEKSIN